MEWWRRHFGLHPVDMTIHLVGTILLSIAAAEASGDDALSILVLVIGLAAYGWRRHRAIAALPANSFTSGESRAIEFEAQAEELHDLRGRLAELDERVDFAERMLAQSREPESLPRNG
jgi:hypothetical protein